jgi:hypothetical protein
MTIDVYLMMSKEDTYDMTLISTMEVLIQKLRLRQKCPNRLYRIEQLNQTLMTLEGMYEGLIPEEYSEKAKVFDDSINLALKELQTL